jgi:hypothetical protein
MQCQRTLVRCFWLLFVSSITKFRTQKSGFLTLFKKEKTSSHRDGDGLFFIIFGKDTPLVLLVGKKNLRKATY